MRLQEILLAGMLLAVQPSYGQGCAQCRDNAASTPPATQAAYRHAIVLMVVAGGSIFAGTVVMLKRHM